ncbi:hypothetical protein C8239_07335 [Paracidovorax avenae]|nr:hypothetical protein C8239_07335 [Paracidovorax avenae]AVS95624.1 hypothetical protein C8232_04570 [Paracidovorax avenae]AVT02295.1 hypothetical protein C8243_07130 [Paracidovorax avenae]AVT09201.1 hypothetical protein C8242_06550 [Paracidovorax avenae]
MQSLHLQSKGERPSQASCFCRQGPSMRRDRRFPSPLSPMHQAARAENYFIGQRDLADTIGRLQSYQEAGADVLYAPGLTRAEDIATVLREVDRPLNVLIGMGVKRVSVGGSLARSAWGAFLRAATELRDHGTVGYAENAVGGSQLNRLLG